MEDPKKLFEDIMATYAEAMERNTKAEKAYEINIKRFELHVAEGDWEAVERSRQDLIESFSAAVDLKIEIARKTADILKRKDRMFR